MDKRKILVVEDEYSINDGLTFALRKEGYDVRSAFNGREALELFKEFNPEVVLLDLMLPDIDGFDICREISKSTYVIMITARGDIFDKIVGLELGADDYIVKPFQIIELRARIQAVIRRFYGRTNPNIEIGILKINPSSRKVYINDEEVKLGVKEFEIVEYIASRHPSIVSGSDIAEHVYDEYFDPVSSVLRVHISRLKKKLKDAAGKEVIITNRGIGYCICEE